MIDDQELKILDNLEKLAEELYENGSQYGMASDHWLKACAIVMFKLATGVYKEYSDELINDEYSA